MSATQASNDTLFQGVYKELWRQIVPPGLTDAEIDFIYDIANLKHQDTLLDMMCGYGRHTIGLARKGVNVRALDNLHAYINEISEIVKKENLPVECIEADLANVQLAGVYDAAVCMGNSFSSFNKATASKVLLNISKHLKEGGVFILNTWMIAEIALRNFKEREWYNIKDYKYLLENKFLLDPTRIETEHTVITKDGLIETKRDTDFILSIEELKEIMLAANLKVTDVFSTPRKKVFSIGDNYAYIVAEKF